MNPIRFSLLTLAAAAIAACSSIPATNPMLEQARSDYRSEQANAQTQSLAPVELKQAGDALANAEAAFARSDDSAQVDQLAYLSRQRTALAHEAGQRKGAEAAIASASAERDKLRLAARTREADNATLNAANARRDTASAQRDTEAAMRQAAASQQQAGEAERRSEAMAAQMREMNAKKTDRGMVVTVGDVLFDSGRAELKSGGVRSVERLGDFLKQYPMRKAMIEGYTDSVGSEQSNQVLSGRRAEAVMAALVGMGVPRGQLASMGFGETHPVAGNDNAGGRQMNRRVEIVLSDEDGVLNSR